MAGEREALDRIEGKIDTIGDRVANLEKDRDKVYHLGVGLVLAWGALTWLNDAKNHDLLERVLNSTRPPQHRTSSRPAIDTWIATPAAAATVVTTGPKGAAL